MAKLALESRGSLVALQLPSLGTRQFLLRPSPYRLPGKGKLAALQDPGPLEPCPAPPSPTPRTKCTAAGTFQPTDGPAGAAATPPKLHRVSAPPPSPRANRGRGRNCSGGILAFFPNLRDPKLKRPRDTVGGQMPTLAFAPRTQRKRCLRRRQRCASLWVLWACAAPRASFTCLYEINVCFC